MNKHIMFSLLLFVNINLFSQTGYKYKSQFIELKVNDSGYFIQTDILNSSMRSAELKSLQQRGLVQSYRQISDNRFLIQSDKQDINKQDYYSHIYYRNSPENYVIILPHIILQLKSGYTADNLLKKYSGVLSVSETNGMKYILICHLKNSEEILKIVGELGNRSDVEWCEPNKLSGYRSFNPLYPQQYYLRNTGQNGGTAGIDINVERAWNITNGSENITVAVIDCGVDRNHEDLENRVLEGYTALNPDGGGFPQNANELNLKAHGMACTGIIAAGNNTVGIRGIANNSRVLPINIVPDLAFRPPWDPLIIIEGFADDIEIARTINWAWKRADILSCSWGGGLPSNDIALAIDSARTYGRNGRGCPVIFASGNAWGQQGITDVAFPGNVDGVITVGAINNRGIIHGYSQRGASMDLVAPSGGNPGDVVTTDRMGSLGYNNTNYTTTFNGTSAACPQVAGVAALMLSVRPDLTEAQVRTTLQNTARDLGSGGFDNSYGYGLVDAYAAVYAVAPRISGPSTVCYQATYTITHFPDSATVQWSAAPSSAVTLNAAGDSVVLVRNFFNGQDVRLYATIYIKGDSLTSLSKDIHLTDNGNIPRVTLDPPSMTCIPSGNTRIFTAIESNNGQSFCYNPDIREIEWAVFDYSTIPPVMVQNYTTSNCNNLIKESLSLYIHSHYQPYVLEFVCRAKNICGVWGEWGPGCSYMIRDNCGNPYNAFNACFDPSYTTLTVHLTDDLLIWEEAARQARLFKKRADLGDFRFPWSDSGKGGVAEIELWSATAMIRRIKTDQRSCQFSVSGLPKGLYVVRVIKDGKIHTRKLIKE